MQIVAVSLVVDVCFEENLLKLDKEKEQELSENIEDLKAKITRLEENLERTERSTA